MILLVIPVFFLIAIPAYAASSDFLAKAQKYFNNNCSRRSISNSDSMLCYLFEKVGEHDQAISQISSNKVIYDVVERRGALDLITSTDNVSLGNQVSINCPGNCKLWVVYFVNARNTGTSSDPRGFFNTYTIYVDGTNQAITNHVSFPTPNAAIPLSLNGVIPVSAGNHTVEIYARVNGGQMENHESGLQVMAIKE